MISFGFLIERNYSITSNDNRKFSSFVFCNTAHRILIEWDHQLCLQAEKISIKQCETKKWANKYFLWFIRFARLFVLFCGNCWNVYVVPLHANMIETEKTNNWMYTNDRLNGGDNNRNKQNKEKKRFLENMQRVKMDFSCTDTFFICVCRVHCTMNLHYIRAIIPI